MSKKIDFSKLSKTDCSVRCWYEEENINTQIAVGSKSLYCTVEHLTFYKELFEILDIFNISSFSFTVYSDKGEVETRTLNKDSLKKKFEAWIKTKKNPPLLFNIGELLQIKL
jgi:hypothetical protein